MSSSSNTSSSSSSPVDKKRFASLASWTQSDQERIMNERDAKNTKRATLSAVRTFKSYLEEKGLTQNFETLPKNELDQILTKFYREARQENGEKYRKSSLMGIRHGLNRHLSLWSIDLIHDLDFKESNKTFSVVMRELKKEYGGVKHYPPILEEDLTKLYQYFGDLNDSVKLQEKVYFDLVIYFGRLGLESFHNLKVSSFAVKYDADGRAYVCTTPDPPTTNHHLAGDPSGGRMYSIPDNNLCPVRSFVRYKKNLNSNCDRLFQRPSKSRNQWYAAIPLGHNTISQMMPNLSEKVGLSKRYSNNSLRATSDHVRESQGKTCAYNMGQDQDHDFLADLMSWCNKLSASGHESFIITTNLERRKMYLSGSKIGKMFLSREREICNRFFKFCQDIYASESAISLSRETVTTLFPNSGQQADRSQQLQSGENSNQLVFNQTENVAQFTPTVGIERETLSYSDDSKVIESSLYDPNIANNIKEETNNMSEYLGARSITEAEFLGLKVETSSNYGETENTDSAYTSNDMDDTQMSQEDSETDVNSLGSLTDTGNDSTTFAVPVNVSSPLQVSPSLFDGHPKSKIILPQKRATSFQPEIIEKALEKINPASVDRQIKELLRIKIKNDQSGASKRSDDGTDKHNITWDEHLPKIITRAGRKMYQCKVCNLRLCSVSSFKRHFLLHDTRGKNEECKVCGKMFLRREDVRKHEQAVHLTKSKDFSCPICSTKLKTYNSLKTHVKKIHNEDIYAMKNPDRVKPPKSSEDKFCNICERQFKTRTGLANHLAVHYSSADRLSPIERASFICDKCGLSFHSLYRYLHHRYTHKSQKNHFCEICKRGFTSLVRKRAHRLVYHGTYTKRALNLWKCYKNKKGKLACDVCGKIFTYKSIMVLRKHLDEVHGRSTKPKRKTSDNVDIDIKQEPRSRPTTPVETAEATDSIQLSETDLKCNIDKWIEKPEKKKPYCCDICQEKFTSMIVCKNHIASHNPDKKIYSCDLCEKVFFQMRSLKKHKLVHVKGGKFSCKTCGYRTTSKEYLTRHSKIHWLIKPHQCDVCGKGFAEAKNLKIHMISHTDEKSYSCNECGKRFRTRKQYRDHVRIHTGERPFKCKICQKSFRAIDVLRNHLKVHSQAKMFMCHLCGKVFRQRSSLITHRKSHLAEPSHKCKICGKGCRSSGSLKSHYVSYHLDHKDLDSYDLKVYKCPICLKLFGEKQDCDRHLRVHTGEKPFICDVCGKAFSDKSNMRSHKKIHTDDRPYVCDLCGKGFIFNRDLKKHKFSHEKEVFKEAKRQNQKNNNNTRTRYKPVSMKNRKLMPKPTIEIDTESTGLGVKIEPNSSTFSASHPTLVAAISSLSNSQDGPIPVQSFYIPPVTGGVASVTGNAGAGYMVTVNHDTINAGAVDSPRVIAVVNNQADSTNYTILSTEKPKK